MGIGAMWAAMFALPLTSTQLAALLPPRKGCWSPRSHRRGRRGVRRHECAPRPPAEGTDASTCWYAASRTTTPVATT